MESEFLSILSKTGLASRGGLGVAVLMAERQLVNVFVSHLNMFLSSSIDKARQTIARETDDEIIAAMTIHSICNDIRSCNIQHHAAATHRNASSLDMDFDIEEIPFIETFEWHMGVWREIFQILSRNQLVLHEAGTPVHVSACRTERAKIIVRAMEITIVEWISPRSDRPMRRAPPPAPAPEPLPVEKQETKRPPFVQQPQEPELVVQPVRDPMLEHIARAMTELVGKQNQSLDEQAKMREEFNRMRDHLSSVANKVEILSRAPVAPVASPQPAPVPQEIKRPIEIDLLGGLWADEPGTMVIAETTKPKVIDAEPPSSEPEKHSDSEDEEEEDHRKLIPVLDQ